MYQPTIDNRLTQAERKFRRKGDAPEIAEWNREFAALIAEYDEAVTCQDEGWIGDLVHEVRKCLEGLTLRQSPCHLAGAARRAVRRSQQRRRSTACLR